MDGLQPEGLKFSGAAQPSDLQTPAMRRVVSPAPAAAPAAAPAQPARDPIDAADAALGLPPRARGLSPPPKVDENASVIGAAWDAETIKTDAYAYSERLRRNLTLDMWTALPAASKEKINQQRFDKNNNWRKFEAIVMDEVRAQAQTVPEAAMLFGKFPQSQEAFDARIMDQRRAELEEAQAVLDQDGGVLAEFAGAGARSLTDPLSIATIPLGGPAAKGAYGVLKFAAVEAGIGAGTELAMAPRRQAVAKELDIAAPNTAMDVAVAAGAGFIFGGALAGAPRVLSYAQARRVPIEQAAREGEDILDAEAAVDAAEAQMRGDTTVVEEIGAPAPTAPKSPLAQILAADTANKIPPVPKDAPEGWAQIRNGIFAGESGGDYDALFGYSNRKNGTFSRVKLTNMTVDQALEFSRTDGPYAQWVKANIGRVATPMGAYQIVGSTLRRAKNGLGLRGDELMTPELQERLGIWIYKQQGTGAWEGYRGPRDTFSAFDPSAPAPDFGPTTRGYTGAGQVSTADGTRIDVAYEVVDMSSLMRASGDLQPRDRSRGISDAWIADTAARLDPAQLMPMPTADRGTPIVGPDNVIESGNGRFGAVERAYNLHPDRADAYRAAIESAGFAVPEGVQRPVLIARRTSEMTQAERVQFAIAAQDSGVAVMNATETARAFARALTPDVLLRFNPNVPLADADNGDFLRAALANLPRSDRNAMFDASGILNRRGNDLLREAMFARAWQDQDIVEMFAEADAGDLRGLLDALAEAVPEWAALKADIEAGLVRPEMDISGYVTDAVRLIATARRNARLVAAARKGGAGNVSEKFTTEDAIAELLDEVDLLAGPMAPLTVALVKKFWANGKAVPADRVATFLTRYANDARKAGQAGGLFDGPSVGDVLRAIDNDTFADVPDDLGPVRGFAKASEDTPAPSPAPTMLDEGFDEGAASAEAVDVDAEIRAEIEASNDQPFGPVFDGYENDPAGAVQKLMAEKTGEIRGAFRAINPEFADVALVYGNKNGGLAHIAEKHPEMLDQIATIMRDGRIVEDRQGLARRYVVKEGNPKQFVVIRLDYDGAEKQWIVTAAADVRGKFDARQLRTSDEPTASVSSRVPDTTAPQDNMTALANNQAAPNTTGQATDDLAEIRAFMAEDTGIAPLGGQKFSDLVFPLNEGSDTTPAMLLKKLDAAADKDEILQLCKAGGSL